MPMKFFAVTALDPAAGEQEINEFLRSHQVVATPRESGVEVSDEAARASS